MEKLCILLLISSLFISTINATSPNQPGDPDEWVERYRSPHEEKFAKLHFYIQDILGGPNATIFEVARSNITSGSPTMFGQVRVLDDLITEEPDRNSARLGRAQGLITSADLNEAGLAMNINFVFTAGPYNGSTLCVLGRNPIASSDRELPIVGGTGVFRMARGFSISNTYSFDVVENYGVLEYSVYVFYV